MARQLIDLNTSAAALGVSVKTLRRYISEGRLTGYRIGPRNIRVDPDELDALARRIPTAG